MNFTHSNNLSFRAGRQARVSGFTFIEVMVAMSIMLLVLAGVLAVQTFGMRMFQLTKAKLGASDDARRAINLLTTEIRTAKNVKIGNSTRGVSDFTECAPGQLQVGSAIQVFATTNTNSFVIYFWNPTNTQLQRVANGGSLPTVVANFVTNSAIFACEDAFGKTLTNNQNNRVVALKLQFYQLQYPIVPIGAGSYYDFYQLTTKTTPRVF